MLKEISGVEKDVNCANLKGMKKNESLHPS